MRFSKAVSISRRTANLSSQSCKWLKSKQWYSVFVLVVWQATSVWGLEDNALIGRLTKEEEDIQLDLGSSFLGSTFDRTIEIENRLNAAIKVRLVPSCNCTSLDTNDLVIAPAGLGKVNLRFKVPSKEGEGAAVIKGFDDAKKKEVFSLVLKYTAASYVVSTPKSVLHRSSEDASVSVRLAAGLPGYSLTKSEFVPSEGWFVSSSENINGAFELKLKRLATNVQPIGDSYDLQFKSTLFNEVDQREVGIFPTRLEVRLSEKVRLGPRTPQFELSSNGAKVKLFAIGEAICDRLPRMSLLLRDRGSNRKTELKISQIEKRGERTVVFSATIEDRQWSELARYVKSGKELFELELSDKDGSSVVSVELASALGER